jgi:hypothetical protein
MDAVCQKGGAVNRSRKLIDLHVRAAPGSLMRGINLRRNGLTRVCRRDCELYSVEITCQGSCGYLKLTDGNGVAKFYQPSAFTGSFVLAGHCSDGLIVDMCAETPPTIMINWREQDLQVV